MLIATSANITVVTHNIPPWLTMAQRLDAFGRATTGAAIWCLQEASWSLDVLPDQRHIFQPRPDSRNHLPIGWDGAVFDCVGQGSIRVFPGPVTMEHVDGLPTVRHDEWFNWVALKHLEAGLIVGVVNGHLPPGMAADRPIRTGLHKLDVDRMVEWGGTLHEFRAGERNPVLVMADFNAISSHPNMQPFQENGWHDDFDLPTFGPRSIDGVKRLGTRLTPVGRRTIKTASDHDAAVVDYNL
jgi:hypothetical protein